MLEAAPAPPATSLCLAAPPLPLHTHATGCYCTPGELMATPPLPPTGLCPAVLPLSMLTHATGFYCTLCMLMATPLLPPTSLCLAVLPLSMLMNDATVSLRGLLSGSIARAEILRGSQEVESNLD